MPRGSGRRPADTPPEGERGASADSRGRDAPGDRIDGFDLHVRSGAARVPSCDSSRVAQDHDLVVCYAGGSKWNPESFTPRFSSATKALGFAAVHYHVLRHTAISVLIKSGTHPKVVQEFAGHHSSAFTMDRYGHIAPSLQREAAERVNALYAGLGVAAV